jgi:hypothetical protein
VESLFLSLLVCGSNIFFTLILAGFLSSTVVIPSEEEHAAYTSCNIKMEDNNQQWSGTMAVGAILALYGVCSLYNWVANIIGNFRFQPQQTTPVVPPAPPHRRKLNLPAFWILSLQHGSLLQRLNSAPATSPARE